MAIDVEFLKQVYARFNARDIEAVLAALHTDVTRANGMEGGHVHGREAVPSYWTRQWTVIDPHVEPTGFSIGADDNICGRCRRSKSSQAVRAGGGPHSFDDFDPRAVARRFGQRNVARDHRRVECLRQRNIHCVIGRDVLA